MRALWVCVLITACGGNNGDGNLDYDHVEIEPPFANVTVELGQTTAQAYTVYGVNGTKREDITSRCGLAIDQTFGTFAGANLTINPRGGKTTVDATCGSLAGQGVLTVNLEGTVVVGPNTPPNAPDIFGTATAGTDPARAPLIEYPIDRAVSPRNIPAIEFQWSAAGNDLFHVALRSSFAEVDLYTSDLEALMTTPDWESLVGSVAGENLAVIVEGLAQSAPQSKFASAQTTLVVTNDDIDKTAIYYWASTQGNIMSQTFGVPEAPALVKDDCTSCHSVSRNGTRIGYSRCVGGDCGQLFAGFLKYDAATQQWGESVNANNKAIAGSYTTFAPIGNPFPDDSQALAMVGMANGTLALYDPDTGAPVASNLADVAPGRSAMMPDWSPDGTKVVFTSTPTPGQYIDLDGGRIATMSYAYTGGAHTFGTPTNLVPDPITLPSGTYQNFFFPSFSPDGNLVVFNAARSAWRNAAAPNGMRSTGARLMLAEANGAYVADLAGLNGGGDNGVTWAHWAPTISSEYYWIVFSSERDYGHRTTALTSPANCKANGVSQCKQIWLGAIAKNKLGAGMDPSAPPMWLPGQDPLANNISPYWSLPTKLQ